MLRAFRRLLSRTSAIPPKDDRAGRGRFGEREAARFLRREKGFRILVRNWRSGRDEIDLVARHGVVLVFVEVRTRDEAATVGGYHSVTGRKKQALRRVCRAYLHNINPRPAHFRFDIVEVRLGNAGDFAIHHFVNVPLFTAGVR